MEITEKKSYKTSKELIMGVSMPETTKSYKPIEHNKLIDFTLEGIEKAGFKLDKESYTSIKGGLVAKASYTISNVKDTEMQLKIGWINSYNKSIRLGWAIGAQIFIK